MPDVQETALISAGVSAVVSLSVSYLTRRSNERTAIDGKVLKSIELAMSYPHVEDADYCKAWNSPPVKLPADATAEQVARYEKEVEKRAQYDLYCCFVFNLIETIWRHCWFPSNIQKIVHVEEFIETHRCWWENQPNHENLFGYDPKFRAYIQSVIDEIKKREAKK